MFFKGLLLGFSLIVAIGPQNAFVIKQGLKKQRVFLTAALASFCDFVLIALGVLGVGQFLTQNQWLKTSLTIGGIIECGLCAPETICILISCIASIRACIK